MEEGIERLAHPYLVDEILEFEIISMFWVSNFNNFALFGLLYSLTYETYALFYTMITYLKSWGQLLDLLLVEANCSMVEELYAYLKAISS